MGPSRVLQTQQNSWYHSPVCSNANAQLFLKPHEASEEGGTTPRESVECPRWLWNIQNFQTRAVEKKKSISQKILILQSRCRFAEWDNLPLLGLLGSLSKPLGQDERRRARSSRRPALQTAEPKANSGGARTSVSASQPPSNTHATKLAKDQANCLTKGLHRYHHSFVKSEPSHGACRPR